MRLSEKRAIALMGLFFFLGGLARGAYLYAKIDGLRGVPELMAGLVWLIPGLFSLRFFAEKDFWKPVEKGVVRIGMMLFCFLLALGCFVLGIYAYMGFSEPILNHFFRIQ